MCENSEREPQLMFDLMEPTNTLNVTTTTETYNGVSIRMVFDDYIWFNHSGTSLLLNRDHIVAVEIVKYVAPKPFASM